MQKWDDRGVGGDSTIWLKIVLTKVEEKKREKES